MKCLTAFLTILDNIIIFSRILLQLRKERAEIATWTILDNIRQYWTILHNIAQYWTIFDYIWKYPTISSNIVSHLIPQKQTYAIPKFYVPFFWGRVLEKLYLLKRRRDKCTGRLLLNARVVKTRVSSNTRSCVRNLPPRFLGRNL